MTTPPIEIEKDTLEDLYMQTDLAYFAEKILDLEIVGHHKDWSRLTSLHSRLAINASRDHGKSHFFSFAYAIWRCYYAWVPKVPESFKSIPKNCLGYLFSSSQDNAVRLLREVRAEIETNPKLAHLLPDKPEIWSAMEIKCANGATLRARGWGVAVRGGHPAFAVCDDILGDENLYSELTRQKDIEYFYSAVTPMVIPNGQIVVVGCVHPDTYVLTESGPTKIGSLSPAKDFSTKHLFEFNRPIYGENGFKNASKYWVNGSCETKIINTRYGLSLEASHRHPVRVQRGKGPSCRGDVVWKRMDELTTDDMLLVEIGQNIYGNGQVSEEMAYFLGLWTAEGSSETCGRISICTTNDTLIQYLKSNPFGLNFKENQNNKWRVQNKEFYDFMADLGVKFARAEGKIIPDSVMQASKKAQAAFIRGFVDGDGCSYVSESIQQINLASASRELIFQLRAVLMNMGMLPSYMVKPPGVSDKVKGKLESHQLVLSGGYAHKFMSEISFTVRHKIKEMRPGRAKQRLFVPIKEIADGKAETVDFVIPDDHTFCSNGFISHNTPFHFSDLYGDLEKNAEYNFFRYPAIKENGEALWPTRYSNLMLERKKREVGNTRFTREYLVRPISDENTLFPEKILRENYDHQASLVTQLTAEIREDYPHIYTGIDLAMSASVAADYSVITTIGIDKHQNRRLLDIRRFKGRSMTEQLREIEDVYSCLQPDRIYIEDNQFQRVFRDELVRNTDLPITGFTTTAKNKNSLERGVPSLQILFENSKFIIPRATERDRRITDVLLHELKCFTYVNGKLQGLGSHDDCLRAGAMIQTINGLKPIEKIKVGELVLTHTGSYSAVTNFIKKPFKGKCYRIEPFGSEAIEMTGEHPILTATKRGSAKGGDFYRSKWISADSAKKGKHRLMFGVNREVIPYPFLDLREFAAKDGLIESDKYLSYSRHKGKRIKRLITINKRFCDFIGCYLAEGHTKPNGQAGIGLHIAEKDRADSVERYLGRLGIQTRRYVNGNSLTIEWSNKVLAGFLGKLGPQHRRKLPKEFLFIEPKLQKVIYDAWIEGDGWNSIGATTSRELANQMYIFLLRNNIVANFRKVGRHRYGAKTRDQWWVERVKNDRSPNRKSKLVGDFRYSAIRDIHAFDIDEDVYNLEVAGDESYVVNHTIVHNCVMSLWIANECSRDSTFNFAFC